MTPYNTSRAVCVRNRRYYQDLDKARGEDISWPVSSKDEADKLARRIREALAAAQHHPDFEQYADLRDLYQLQARKGWVRAQWLGPRDEGAKSPTKPERLEVKEAESVMGVVGAAIKYKDRADEIYCPNAVITDRDEKLKLWKWCRQSGWQYIDQFDGGLTITQRKVDPILLYDPSEDEG